MDFCGREILSAMGIDLTGFLANFRLWFRLGDIAWAISERIDSLYI
ncbi:hypothetical protein GFS31_02470 [Leptolyngbya sp. BL0902]|nr:hypothetical protein GFS31_02470 [Leptolyngbya sp. BL0902]